MGGRGAVRCLERRFSAYGSFSPSEGASALRTVCRMRFGDTAECNSVQERVARPAAAWCYGIDHTTKCPRLSAGPMQAWTPELDARASRPIPSLKITFDFQAGVGCASTGFMPKYTWTIAAGIVTTLFLLFVGTSVWNQRQALRRTRAELEAARAEAANQRTEAESRRTVLESKLGELQQQAEKLRREKEQAVKSRSTLEQEMRAALESKDVTISELQGKLEINILDRILFDSGQTVIKPEGQKVLHQLAKVLEQYPHRQLHVVGHTDNVPIKGSLATRYPTNWELSAARATAAVRYLVEKAGVDPRRLGAVGYGEHRPVADNSAEEGRARNRRITIVVLPELFAGVEPETKVPVAPPEAKPGAAPEPKPEGAVPSKEDPKGNEPIGPAKPAEPREKL